MAAWTRLAHVLYCSVATEILVDVVDVVLEGSGIDEKFLGITLFALVPNTTEFMNAISFAINGNIALRYIVLHADESLADFISCVAWKSGPPMHFRFVSYRSQRWLHFRLGINGHLSRMLRAPAFSR